MTRLEMVAALRKSADTLETMELPDLDWRVKTDVCAHFATRQDMADFIRVVGKVKKDSVESSFWVTHRVGDLEVVVYAADREQVCRKVVTIRTLPPEPEKIIPAQPERVVEEVTWDCEPILAEREVEKVAVEQSALRMAAHHYAQEKGM